MPSDSINGRSVSRPLDESRCNGLSRRSGRARVCRGSFMGHRAPLKSEDAQAPLTCREKDGNRVGTRLESLRPSPFSEESMLYHLLIKSFYALPARIKESGPPEGLHGFPVPTSWEVFPTFWEVFPDNPGGLFRHHGRSSHVRQPGPERGDQPALGVGLRQGRLKEVQQHRVQTPRAPALVLQEKVHVVADLTGREGIPVP